MVTPVFDKSNDDVVYLRMSLEMFERADDDRFAVQLEELFRFARAFILIPVPPAKN
jgi:hypothetical protein